MKIRIFAVVLVACCFFMHQSVTVQPQEIPSGETTKGSWKVSIVKASQPAKVKVVGEALYGRGGAPPAKHKWLQLHVRLTPPAARHSVSLKALAVVDGSSVYPAQAIAQVEPGPAFSFFGDATKRDFSGRTPTGFGLLDSQGDMSVMVVDAGGTSGMVMAMQKREAIGMLLLFAVPATTKKLAFQIENGQRIPIRLVARN